GLSKLDLHLQHRLKGGSAHERVIIKTKPGSRADVGRSLKRQGQRVYGDHVGIEAVSAKVSAAVLRALTKNPAVESISTDADVESLDSKKGRTSTSTPGSTPPTTPVVSALLKTLGLANYPLGSTIGVAVIDSGMQDDGNFTGR